MEEYSEYGGRVITIGIRTSCNFNCFYCIGGSQKQKLEIFDLEQIKLNYLKIQKLTDMVLTAFECGTGEPTLHPQIKELLELCLDYGPVVSFPTNNSIHPRYWLPAKKLEYMTVKAALHPENESNINRFLEHLLYLKEIGVKVSVLYICHPKRYHKKESYKEFFKIHKIPIQLIPYTGIYKNIEYPNAYNKLERTELNLDKNWTMDLVFEGTWRNFKGIPCIAGYIDFFVNTQGKLFRCLYDSKSIENVFTEPKPCRVSRCGCGFLLDALNGRGTTFWNYWRNICSLKQLPEKKPSFEERILEKRTAYYSLKKKYALSNFDIKPNDIKRMTIHQRSELKNFKKILLFGAGSRLSVHLSFIRSLLSEDAVLVACDNDRKKWGLEIESLPIIAPDDIAEFYPDVIIITSIFYHEIADQLLTTDQNSNLGAKIFWC